MNEKTLAQRLFHRLIKGYYKSEYIVLNDMNYYATIWADTLEEALALFENGKYGENKQ